MASPSTRPRMARRLRQLHRWSGIVFGLVLGVIAVTGTILQAIMAIYGDTGPMRAPGEPLWVLGLRDGAVMIHTGAFTGIAGVYVAALCGLSLLFFTVSGLWIYIETYQARASRGRKAIFWRTPSGRGALLRSLHRWATLPLALFAVLLSLTGISLSAYFARYGIVPLPPVRSGGHQGGPPQEGRLWHDVSLSLHKLNFLGDVGHGLGIALGLGLTVMAACGLWLVILLYAPRRKAGLTNPFW